jgi:hypothetical protein
MISRSQMNRQLYQMGGEGMQEGIGSMMGQAMMQPQVQEQEQVPQKDYAKIKQILKQLYASNPQKFQEFLMKIKDKLPPEVLQELVMAIQEEDRNMAAMGGIMSVPRARYGFGSFVSSIAGGIGDFIGGAADVVGDVVGGIGDVVGDIASSIDLGDVATAAAFYFGGPKAAAFVNSATGGTGNKYLDMGLNLYAGGVGQGGGGFDIGSAFSSGFDDFGTGGVFPQSGGGFFDDFGTGGIFPQSGGGSGGVSGGVLDDFGTGGVFPQSGEEGIFTGASKILKEQLDKLTGKDYVDLAKLGGSAYAARLARKDQERINRIVEEENRRFREAQAAKRSQYGSPSTLGAPEQATTADVVRAPVAMGGRMRYAMGNSVQDGIMAAPQIAMQMGMPVGNPRRNQQGVTELDYRNEGGFVPPIGIKEKADDIPAMLSNNEFVFTANAVKNAGGGDSNVGAKKMYTLMKRLENGGIV